METRDHFKNGTKPKSHTSRKYFLLFGILLLAINTAMGQRPVVTFPDNSTNTIRIGEELTIRASNITGNWLNSADALVEVDCISGTPANPGSVLHSHNVNTKYPTNTWYWIPESTDAWLGYYARIRAWDRNNGWGNYVYVAIIPTVKTSDATGIKSNSAILNGAVTSSYSSRGFEYRVKNSSTWLSGASMPLSISGLTPNTQYEFRAYASMRNTTGYGVILDFRTLIYYTVAYNGNGHTGGSMPPSTHYEGEAKNLTSNGFTRAYTVTYNYNGNGQSNGTGTANYSFRQWSSTSGGGSPTYTNNQSVTNLSATNGATVNLYAQWNAGTVSLPTPNSRAGYTFSGWYTASSGGTYIGNGGTTYTPTAAITLYARWTPTTYTVYYYGNGNTGGSTASSSHTYGVARNLTSNGFTRAYTVTYNYNGNGQSNGTGTANYSFSHWGSTPAGGIPTYTNNQNVTNVSPTDLYAQWNAGSVSLPTPNNRTDYVFIGWYTATSGGTFAGDKGATYTPTANITLYARWQWAQDPYLNLSQSSLNGSDASTTFPSVTVSSNLSWVASSSNSSWLTVTPTSGSNNGSISVRVSENTSTSSRSGTITVSGSGISRTISVTQSGATPQIAFPVFDGLAGEYSQGASAVTLKLKGAGAEKFTVFKVNGTTTSTFNPSVRGTHTIEAVTANSKSRIITCIIVK